MRRILLLASLALMLASALAVGGVAQANTTIGGKAQAKCKNLAIATIGPDFDPSGYTFVVGTAGNDTFTNTLGQREVFCGYGGDDVISYTEQGEFFLGGAGDDAVGGNFGTFYGGADDDYVQENVGTFYGEAGADSVTNNHSGSTFNGGDGTDSVSSNGGILVDVP